MKRKHLSARKLIFKRDNYTCYLCGKKFDEKKLHVDHIFPYSKGGDHDLKNLKTCCKKCNLEKRDSIVFKDIKKYFIDDKSKDYILINPKAFDKYHIKYIVAYIKEIL